MMLSTILTVLLLATGPAPSFQEAMAKAQALYDSDHPQEAVEMLNEILPSVRESGDNDALAECLSVLSTSYTRMGAMNLALAAQTECYHLDLETGEPSYISSSLNNLAGICIYLGEYDMALDYILEAIRYEEPLGNPAALAVRYGLASEAYQMKNNLAESEEYALKALEITRQTGDEVKIAVRKSQLSEVYLKTGRLKEARALLEEAIEVLEKNSAKHSLSIALRQMGSAALGEGNSREAYNYFSRALAMSEELGNKNHQKRLSMSLAQVLRDTDPIRAMGYLEDAIALSDSIFQEQTASKLSAQRGEYEMMMQEKEIEQQKKDLRAVRLFIILLSFLALVLVAGVVLLVRYLYTERRNVRMLEDAAALKDRMLSLLGTSGEGQSSEIKKISQSLSYLGQEPQDILTKKERQVAEYCYQGLVTKEIADRMNISQRTVETHKRNIFQKLEISSTLELVVLMKEVREKARKDR